MLKLQRTKRDLKSPKETSFNGSSCLLFILRLKLFTLRLADVCLSYLWVNSSSPKGEGNVGCFKVGRWIQDGTTEDNGLEEVIPIDGVVVVLVVVNVCPFKITERSDFVPKNRRFLQKTGHPYLWKNKHWSASANFARGFPLRSWTSCLAKHLC